MNDSKTERIQMTKMVRTWELLRERSRQASYCNIAWHVNVSALGA